MGRGCKNVKECAEAMEALSGFSQLLVTFRLGFQERGSLQASLHVAQPLRSSSAESDEYLLHVMSTCTQYIIWRLCIVL